MDHDARLKNIEGILVKEKLMELPKEEEPEETEEEPEAKPEKKKAKKKARF